MGFEVHFSFYEKQSNEEDFNREESEIKTSTITIGDPVSDVPPERVAATILKKFTNQNIWIEDVEVFEWIKKKIRYSETKSGGVKLGTKAYNLGLNEIMKWAVGDLPPQQVPQQVPQQAPQQAPQQVPQQAQQQAPQQQLILPNQQPMQYTPGQQQEANQQPIAEQKMWPHEQMAQQSGNQMGQDVQQSISQGTYASTSSQAYPGQDQQQRMRLQNKVSGAGLQYAQRIEVCDPPPELRNDLSGLALTPGKQYQILDEQIGPNGNGYVYKVVNDRGRELIVGWHYFRQRQAVRQETSYYDNRGNLQTAASYVDQAAAPSTPQPRLLYQNAEAPLYRTTANTSSDPSMNNMLTRMDAAVQRRTPRR